MTEREREVLTLLEQEGVITKKELKRLNQSGKRSEQPFSASSLEEVARRKKDAYRK